MEKQQNLNITLDKTTAVTCECENETFIPIQANKREKIEI